MHYHREFSAFSERYIRVRICIGKSGSLESSVGNRERGNVAGSKATGNKKLPRHTSGILKTQNSRNDD